MAIEKFFSSLSFFAFKLEFMLTMLERRKLHADPIATERTYLRALLGRYIPRRMVRIYRVAELRKTSVLVASIISVGLGFIYGYIREGVVGWKRR